MVRFAVGKSDVKPNKSVMFDNNWNKKRSKKHFWANKFVEFCKRTDLHGYKYIVMEDFNYVERSCWALAVVMSIGFAAYFVVTAFKWYARNPIITVIESTQGAIWDMPFPAVTICDLNIVSRKAAKELANNLTLPENVTADSVFQTLRLVPLLYSMFKANDEEKSQLRQLQEILDTNDISVIDMFKMLSPAASCTQLVQRCMWKNSIYRCDELFRQIFTPLSLCCTFNYYAVNENKFGLWCWLVCCLWVAVVRSEIGSAVAPWIVHANLSNGLSDLDVVFSIILWDPNQPEFVSLMNTPRRVASCGYQTALTVLLYTNPEDYYSTAVASQGVLVFIDNAYNLPDLDSPVRMVNPATEVLIALSPERTYTTAGVKSFSPNDRQCYYSDEIQIANFRQYSFHNCMAYQKVKLMKILCGCVPLFFPMRGQHRFCNFLDMDCIENVFVREEYNSRNGSENSKLFKCLPECEHYDYPIEVALGKLADTVYVKGLPFFDDVSLLNRSLLNVFFNDLVSTRYRRDVYLNWQNILAAFGGLLSLMLGFTLIAGVDLLLFFTVRIAYNSCSSEKADEKPTNKIKVHEYHKRDKWMPPAYSQRAFKIYKNDSYGHGAY